jgi:hypothetical protein
MTLDDLKAMGIIVIHCDLEEGNKPAKEEGDK